VRSRTKPEKDKNMALASIGAGLRLRIGNTSANAEDSKNDEMSSKGEKKRITGMDIVVKPSSKKVERGRTSRGGKR